MQHRSDRTRNLTAQTIIDHLSGPESLRSAALCQGGKAENSSLSGYWVRIVEKLKGLWLLCQHLPKLAVVSQRATRSKPAQIRRPRLGSTPKTRWQQVNWDRPTTQCGQLSNCVGMQHRRPHVYASPSIPASRPRLSLTHQKAPARQDRICRSQICKDGETDLSAAQVKKLFLRCQFSWGIRGEDFALTNRYSVGQ